MPSCLCPCELGLKLADSLIASKEGLRKGCTSGHSASDCSKWVPASLDTLLIHHGHSEQWWT